MPVTMTHRERAIAALECRIPDRIPHFELEYQLSELTFGKRFTKIFSSSNCIFNGIEPERYQLMLDIWKKHRDY